MGERISMEEAAKLLGYSSARSVKRALRNAKIELTHFTRHALAVDVDELQKLQGPRRGPKPGGVRNLSGQGRKKKDTE